jgi:hypothetical protein
LRYLWAAFKWSRWKGFASQKNVFADHLNRVFCWISFQKIANYCDWLTKSRDSMVSYQER